MDKTVFISGLPYTTTIEQVQEFFDGKQFENIKLPRFQDSGRLIGYGHITFQNAQDAKDALKKNMQTLGNRYIEVKEAQGQKEKQPIQQTQSDIPEDCKRIFVKNLPYDSTSESIGEIFKNCGQVENIRMVYNNQHQHFKGFCYIDFGSTSSLKKALKLNGKTFEGRQLVVDFDTGQPKAGFKYAKEQVQNANKFNKEIEQIQKKKIKKVQKSEKVKRIRNFAETQRKELAQKRNDI